MQLLRTRFGKNIIADFLPPIKKSRETKVIIFCGGLPTVPGHKKLLEFYSKKGFWVFEPRYKGTWESGGKFLQNSPDKDILEIINQFPKGFVSLWDNKTYKINYPKITFFGTSFSGATGILISRDKRVSRAVLLAPVTDWAAVNKSRPRDAKLKFLKEAYGEAYRVSQKDWDKLKSGKFFNPVNHIDEIGGKKLLIFHAKNDEIVPYKSVLNFSKQVGAKLITLRKGGHLSSRTYMEPDSYKKIKQFLR